MAGLINQLMGVLNEQLGYYEQLLELSQNKTAVLVSNDLESLKHITAAENTVIGKLQRSEKNRMTLINDIAFVLNENATSLTLSRISERLQGQAEHDEFCAIAQNLRAKADELHNVNEHNKLLIESSLDFVEFNMNVIRSASNPEFPTYGDIDKKNIGKGKSFLDVSN